MYILVREHFLLNNKIENPRSDILALWHQNDQLKSTRGSLYLQNKINIVLNIIHLQYLISKHNQTWKIWVFKWVSFIEIQLLNTAKLYNCRCEWRIAKYCQVKLSQIRGKDNFRESGRWGHLCSNRASGQAVLTKIVSLMCWKVCFVDDFVIPMIIL